MSVLAADPIVSRRGEIQRTAAASLRRRQTLSKVGIVACVACLGIALVPLVAVLTYVVGKGISAWSADFFTHLPTPAGIPGGGVHNAIVGSLVIDGIAAAGAIPFGILAGLFLAQSDGRVAGVVRFSADVFAGMPSILIGVFAYGLLVATLGHFSAVAASFALGMLMLPIVIRASETAIRSVPRELNEAALSLGARAATTARRVVLPAALPGLITGVMLAVARAAGETAPLLFTAIGSQYWSTSPLKPIAALPLVVFQNGIQAYPDLQQQAWGAALLLVVAVLVVNVGSRAIAAWIGRTKR